MHRSIQRNLFSLTIDITLSRDQFLRYYKGTVRSVVTRARSGETLQFPASALRPYVGANGVHGAFRIRYDDRGKLVDMTPLQQKKGA